MQNAVVQSAIQPFAKLTQANMELLSKFSMSPEVTTQAMNDAQKIFEMAQASATRLTQSHAFAGLMEGLMNNIKEFYAELGHSGSAMFSQGQAAFMQQAQTASDNLKAASETGARRIRAAA